MTERHTKQKKIVAQVIQEAGRPLTIQEILVFGQVHLPTLGIATIYREVNRLCENKELQPVHIPGDVLRYETNAHHHHHFKCQACDKVYELEGCLTNIQTLIPPGFKASNHEITFYGTCHSCS